MLHKFKKKTKGFTLVELMVVVLILGLLTAIGIPTYRAASNAAERKIVEANLRMIDDALKMYLEIDNSKEINAYNVFDILVPDYLNAPISGPKTAVYGVFNPNNEGLRACVDFKGGTVGGHHFKYAGVYTIDTLPWNR